MNFVVEWLESLSSVLMIEQFNYIRDRQPIKSDDNVTRYLFMKATRLFLCNDSCLIATCLGNQNKP